MNYYLPLKSISSKLSDEYYRCLTDSLTHSNGSLKLKECLSKARKYRKALRAQLEGLARLNDPVFVRRELELVREYLQLIDHDLLGFLNDGQIKNPRKRRPDPDH